MNAILLANGWLADLPTFDWQAAIFVGAIVTVVAAVVIVAAIATPFVAVQGALTYGTFLAIAAISATVGVAGGTAAGFFWGRQIDIDTGKVRAYCNSMSRRFEIFFEPSEDDPDKAKDFNCTLVYYATDDKKLKVIEHKEKIDCRSSDNFYQAVEHQVINWLERRERANPKGESSEVTIYMVPFPQMENLNHPQFPTSQLKGRMVIGWSRRQQTEAVSSLNSGRCCTSLRPCGTICGTS